MQKISARILVLSLTAVALSGCATSMSKPEVNLPPKPTVQSNLPSPTITANTLLVNCNGQTKSVSQIVDPIIERMEKQHIDYTQDPSNEWRDCSGIFLRVSSYLASACPNQQSALIAPPGIKDYSRSGPNVAPTGVKERTSRDIAKWFYDQRRFTPIFYDGVNQPSEIPASLKKNRNSIHPGSVLWFAFSQPKSGDGILALFDKTKRKGTHINHMAIVTAVTKDPAGNLTSIEMFHGSNKKHPASITTEKWSRPDKMTENGPIQYPALGYGSQYLVGIADLLPGEEIQASK